MAPQYTIVVRPSSLVILLKQKPLNDITTKDIIESAEASRKTFYTYYKDKTRPVNGN
ncbi:TetR/AcrR family transcriptional regulator [Limosilactobacillus fermentum]|nr:TetR/AcrR family transcriptional regulator [Limosilactobacillus fermentum]UVZ01772.1 TetR/AcrR family transcriptional regulator [Limosilactobacillus fermentum]